ncbi:hypothetical protein BGW38_000392 [Lunasporangiospora selenospora]|uniref:FIST domain-containing protein n=1 Tax=Lunasporangiospora selenospora TaxID=979761 RepID=A0A9P6FVL4_9FUNG|nr:hypothetical protein BGW38_000392 [Lunasporangiospora selenospora]
MHLVRSITRLSATRPFPLSRRHQLWTAATSAHPDLATALRQCFPASAPSDVSSGTTTVTPSAGTKDSSVTIILASRSYPGSDLLSLPSKAPVHVSQSSTVLAAVVDRVPTKSGHGVSTLTISPTAPLNHKPVISCKAFFLSGADSRRKRLKEKSVGRWARTQDLEERSLDSPEAWADFKSISIGQNQVQVPEAAFPIVPLDSNLAQQQDIFMISDLEVHQFLEALDTVNPEATKLGLVASSTPFITGRPVTMFYEGKLVEDGVLGVTITTESGKIPEKTRVEYPSMAPLGPAMQITRCRGNIILELDESNATRLLLDQLQATTLTKDKEYFLATTSDPSGVTLSAEKPAIDMNRAMVYKITGGDPSKGNMAVDTVHDLQVGQWVQFIHHNQVQESGHFHSSTTSETMRFTASDPNKMIEEQESNPEQEAEKINAAVEKVFGGSSENGFVVGLPNRNTWVCDVTDSVLTHDP